MKKLIIVLSIIFLIDANIQAQSEFNSYYAQNVYGLTSPGAMKYGLYGHDNPALLSTLTHPDLLLTWSDATGKFSSFNHWAMFFAVPNFGFSAVTNRFGNVKVTDYRMSVGFGSQSSGFGLGYGWSAGDVSQTNRSDIFTLGTFFRPGRYVSIGLMAFLPTTGQSEGAIDLAIRPFGNEKISVFGDYVYRKNRFPSDIKWSAGVAVEPLSGLRVTARYFDTKFFNIGAQVSLGNIGFTSQAVFDKNSDHSHNIYGIRVGGYDRNILSGISSRNSYAELNLNGQVRYQRFKWFDNSNTLAGLLEQIDAAMKDKTISGIAINTSGMQIDRTKLWEIREKLKDFKATGKKVFVYIDNVSFDQYHFASIADKIVMDPLGMITLEGYVAGRTFLKGTLEKVGIGFIEWRYFKYKSAYENFSRDKMSEGDSEQRLKYIQDNYDLAKNEISSLRNISREKFDELVNDVPIYMSDAALKNNLADQIGRWEDLKKLVEETEGSAKNFVSPYSLEKFHLPRDNYWGEKPRVAVIYALGVCAMDEGITARRLMKDVKNAVENPNVKAIVFRVDSPGGDALASDLVAEELKKAKGKKPVIISQGSVAASGGYWLSMYGDTIVAAPNTVTGSIGVIGGWFYNKELKEKLGMTTDHVKVGAHADLGYGFVLPFIGVSLPDRDLTDTEQKIAEELIKGSYKNFVSKVASGRNMSEDKIENVAQGRIWSGTEGKKLGLVDVVGGLDHAIDIAVKRAGLYGKEYDVIEIPEPPLVDFSMFMPKLFSIEIKEKDETIEHLKFRMKNNGKPLPLLPLDEMEWMLFR